MAGKPILPLHGAVAGAESWSPLDVTSATGWLCLVLRYHIPQSVHQEQRQSCCFEMASFSAVCKLLMRPQCINTSLIKT